MGDYRDYTEAKTELDAMLYTKKELEILYGKSKKPVSDAVYFKLFDKVVAHNDIDNAMRLLRLE